MLQKIVSTSLLLAVASCLPAPQDHNLPVLFQFSHPTHNVAVYRGADLKKAIAAGLVKGFGNSGAANTASLGDEDRDGRSDDSDANGGDGGSYAAPATTTLPPPPPPTYATTTPPPPPPTTTPAYVAPETVAPTYSTPAPVVYKPAPVVYKPAPAPVVYKPAPAPVVYKPAPAPVVYKPAPAPVTYKPAPVVYKPAPAYKAASSYAEPAYADVPAVYTWEYAVKDDYSNNDFGANESRDGYLTNGKYYVALPDGRLQTVTYTVDGGNGYVPVVEYVGEAQYPDAPAPSYSS